jgi:hypothetical protein
MKNQFEYQNDRPQTGDTPGLPETGWILSRIWLAALEETARDFHGNWPKVFCDRAYEHATTNWISVMENEYDFIFRRDTTMIESLRSYIDIGLQAGLFRDASDFRIKEANQFKIEVTIYRDIYSESYKELYIKEQPIREMTNARLGCFRAAIKLLSNINCDYEVTAIHSDGVVEGFIERL